MFRQYFIFVNLREKMQDNLIMSANVGKTHGFDGWLRIHSCSGEIGHLEKLRECTVIRRDGHEVVLHVDAVKSDSASLLMRFAGYDTKEKASSLSGGRIYVRREDASHLEEGEYYIADLFGLSLVFKGNEVGKVEAVCDGSQADYLLIRKNDGKKFYLPNMEPFVSRPDFEAGSIELLMGSLLEM